jgi:hypothetical protein
MSQIKITTIKPVERQHKLEMTLTDTEAAQLLAWVDERKDVPLANHLARELRRGFGE